jgi:hypothetical protein
VNLTKWFKISNTFGLGFFVGGLRVSCEIGVDSRGVDGTDFLKKEKRFFCPTGFESVAFFTIKKNFL